MKCSNVQSVIVEYAEGALGPADEMCIDIHLIQCEECRAELSGLRDLLGTVAREVHTCVACDDPIGFLDQFHALELDSAPPVQNPAPLRRQLPLLRLTAAAVALVLMLSSGVMGGRIPAWFPVLGAPVAEARTHEQDRSPFLRNGLNLADLDKMGLLPEVEPNSAPGGD